jgi:hypothetical protein
MSRAIAEVVHKILEMTGQNKADSVINKLKTVCKDILNAATTPGAAYEVVHKNFLFLKVFGFGILILLAIFNASKYKDVGLISKKPGLFAAESAVFGLSGALPFLMLCYFRNKAIAPHDIAIYGTAFFFIFFAVNYILELSGIYSATFYEEKEGTNAEILAAEKKVEEDEKELSYAAKFVKSFNRSSDTIILTIFGVSLLLIVIGTCFVRDTSNPYVRFTDFIKKTTYGSYSLGGIGIFLLEALLFGVMSAVPVYFIASNRGGINHETSVEFGLIILKFSIVHAVLQFSGLYSTMFAGVPPHVAGYSKLSKLEQPLLIPTPDLIFPV